LSTPGGDLRVFGPQQFPILCRRAVDDRPGLELQDAAAAVSRSPGLEAPAEHRSYYDRSAPGRRPVDGVDAVAVVTPGPALAGGLAKWLLFDQGTAVRKALESLGGRLL
jgi:hypothetical protein